MLNNIKAPNIGGFLIKIDFFFIILYIVFSYFSYQIGEKMKEDAFESAISVVAHEIRSSLSEIYSTAEFLLEHQLDVRDSRKKIIRIQSKMSEALDLMQEICEWARNKDLKPTRISFCAHAEMARVLEKYIDRLTEKRIVVRLDVKKEDMYTDKRIFLFVFENILSNAVKFTPQGGTISILFAGYSSIRSLLRVTNDIEKPIDEDALKNFFSVDRRHERGTAGERGVGLGLSLVKKFCDEMLWDIDLSCNKKFSISVFM